MRGRCTSRALLFVVICTKQPWLLQVSFSVSFGFGFRLMFPLILSKANGQVCLPKRKAPTTELKRVWTVGVLAIKGPEEAFAMFNATFNDYLTATVGGRFDFQENNIDDASNNETTTIRFEMKAIDFLQLFSDIDSLDFMYVNPSAFSCIESEYDARSLVSQISRRIVGGRTYDLKQFGGVIMARADRDDLQTLADLEDKVVAAASISGLGSGQMQFRKMIEAGLNYLTVPKQVVFTSNQGSIVTGVLKGDFDVGFVRTDQIESSKDDEGNPINGSLFKVIEPRLDLKIDEVPFPFPSSTALYPEWNLAALAHVPDVVAAEVQAALLALADHAQVAMAVNTTNSSYNNLTQTVLNNRRCDTTDRVAETALAAMTTGMYAGWTPTLSYMELRSMQELTGFIRLDPIDKTWKCIRSAELYDSIVCPEGWLIKTRKQVAEGCAEVHLKCLEGYQCICHPCYEDTKCIDSVRVGGTCVGYNVLLPAILVPIGIIVIAAFIFVIWYKSQQMVKQAKSLAKNERELNEFIAHEVRNPLSAAISASIFVHSAIQSDLDEDTRNAIREDAGIISSSLKFINDLLRSMLDLNRATKDQMVLEDGNDVDVQHDIFEPVASMIYNRDTNWTVLIKCPRGLVIQSDKLRLQQVVLNLARNSAKFVEKGFVRLRADVVDNNVHLYIEDSGPGIPEEKRHHLFSKYQQSLDTMAQGTGVGLSLCQKLVALMDGTIELDEKYHSGDTNNPGACIVIALNQAPAVMEEGDLMQYVEIDTKAARNQTQVNRPIVKKVVFDERDSGLPRVISILYVDDDRNLRKLAIRSLRNACPNWYIREAANGETALVLCESEFFDIIFLDQYFTSVEQCLRGTETLRALRSMGVKSIVCGVSANDTSAAFEKAGADFFVRKPFPVENDELDTLLRTLISKRANLEDDKVIPDSIQVRSKAGQDDVSLLETKSLGSSVMVASLENFEEQPDEGDRSVAVPPSVQYDLDSAISVLFVDDDRILRRLAIRALRGCMPHCSTRETDSGESALRLCAAERFELIFIDQHMTSTTTMMIAAERLKGSETVAELRRLGNKSIITGLSANHSSMKEFMSSGADNFQLKPFPCAQSELRPLLMRLLSMISGAGLDDVSSTTAAASDAIVIQGDNHV